MKLSRLIDELKQHPADAPVRLELVGMPGVDGLMAPNGVDSYRGYYDQLAIEYYAAGASGETVGSFLGDLLAAVGATFQGYKGGDFTMDGDTNVWCSNYGESTGWAPAEVVARDGQVVIRAFDFDRW